MRFEVADNAAYIYVINKKTFGLTFSATALLAFGLLVSQAVRTMLSIRDQNPS